MAEVLAPDAILEKLIGFPTISSDTNLPLIDWVAAYLEGHGITPHRWVDPDQPHKAALFAHVGPWEPGGVVLSGHTDVVPVAGQAWDSDPFTLIEKEGRYYGRGTCDMKGYDALAIWALVEAARRGVKRPLQLALSFDEEVGCTGAPPMIEAMQGVLPKARAVIVGEPSMMKTVTGHKAGQGFTLTFQGFEVHSSLLPEGVSAILEAGRMLEWVNATNAEIQAAPRDAVAEMFYPPFTTLHVGNINGGTARNITARECRMDFEMRVVPSDDKAALRERFLARVAEVRAGMQAVRAETDILVEPLFGVPGLKPEENGDAETLVRALSGDNSSNVVSYGTEAGQFQEAGYSAVVCGPGDIAQAHQPNEFLEIAQFREGEAFMDRLVTRLS